MADTVASGAVDPARENPWRRPKRWLLAVLLPAFCCLLVVSGTVTLLEGANTGGLSPWPGPHEDPRSLLPDEVPALGFHLLGTANAAGYGLWARGRYVGGVVAFYGVGRDTVSAVWILRYGTPERAKQDFDWSDDWLETATDARVWAGSRVGGPGAATRAGVTSKLAEYTCLHRNWIVAMWADGRYGVATHRTLRAMREAISARWRSRAVPPGRRRVADGFASRSGRASLAQNRPYDIVLRQGSPCRPTVPKISRARVSSCPVPSPPPPRVRRASSCRPAPRSNRTPTCPSTRACGRS